MKRYGNRSGRSGVAGYEIHATAIVVEFLDGWKYEYTARSVGLRRLATMKRLAASGQGLSTYIAQEIRDAYARRFR